MNHDTYVRNLGVQRGRPGVGTRVPPPAAPVVPDPGAEDGKGGAVPAHPLPFLGDLQDASLQRGPLEGDAQRGPGDVMRCRVMRRDVLLWRRGVERCVVM